MKARAIVWCAGAAFLAASCESRLEFRARERQGAIEDSLRTERQLHSERVPGDVERVKVGACWYVILRGDVVLGGVGNTGVAIVHAGDCDNPAHAGK